VATTPMLICALSGVTLTSAEALAVMLCSLLA